MNAHTLCQHIPCLHHQHPGDPGRILHESCYGRSLAPNICNRLTIFFLLLTLSLVLIDKILFSLMTAMLSSHQAYACPLPHAVHNFHFTSVLCTSMLLISFTTCLMLTFHFSLRQCLLFGCAFFSILPPPCGCIMSFFHPMAMLDACP